jgi:hypothetical protein
VKWANRAQGKLGSFSHEKENVNRKEDIRVKTNLLSPNSLLSIFSTNPILALNMKVHLEYLEASTSTLQIADGVELPELKMKRM